MNDLHGAHGATGIVETLFLIHVHERFCRGMLQARCYTNDDGASVVVVFGNRMLSN